MIPCVYCRDSHQTMQELQECGDRFWARVDAEAQRDREDALYLAQTNEIERESFE